MRVTEQIDAITTMGVSPVQYLIVPRVLATTLVLPLLATCFGVFGQVGAYLVVEATGLPLGLFSHTTQSAGACHLVPGSALLVVSRGVIEAEQLNESGQDAEFGLNGVRQSLQEATVLSAHDVCLSVLQSVRQFTLTAPTHNDLTTLALVRNMPTNVH